MQPRFLFVVGRHVRGVPTPPWPATARAALADRARTGGWVAWRLVGANHRELARSAKVFRNLSDAETAAHDLQARAPQVTSEVLTNSSNGLWWWSVSLDDAVVAVAAREYQRPRECVYNLRVALEAVVRATICRAGPG